MNTLAYGKGVAQDSKEAVRDYTIAAEQGNDRAQYDLGMCFDDGDGVA